MIKPENILYGDSPEVRDSIRITEAKIRGDKTVERLFECFNALPPELVGTRVPETGADTETQFLFGLMHIPEYLDFLAEGLLLETAPFHQDALEDTLKYLYSHLGQVSNWFDNILGPLSVGDLINVGPEDMSHIRPYNYMLYFYQGLSQSMSELQDMPEQTHAWEYPSMEPLETAVSFAKVAHTFLDSLSKNVNVKISDIERVHVLLDDSEFNQHLNYFLEMLKTIDTSHLYTHVPFGNRSFNDCKTFVSDFLSHWFVSSNTASAACLRLVPRDKYESTREVLLATTGQVHELKEKLVDCVEMF